MQDAKSSSKRAEEKPPRKEFRKMDEVRTVEVVRKVEKKAAEKEDEKKGRTGDARGANEVGKVKEKKKSRSRSRSNEQRLIPPFGPPRSVKFQLLNKY